MLLHCLVLTLRQWMVHWSSLISLSRSRLEQTLDWSTALENIDHDCFTMLLRCGSSMWCGPGTNRLLLVFSWICFASIAEHLKNTTSHLCCCCCCCYMRSGNVAHHVSCPVVVKGSRTMVALFKCPGFVYLSRPLFDDASSFGVYILIVS